MRKKWDSIPEKNELQIDEYLKNSNKEHLTEHQKKIEK
jgi:hypothetical protein